MNTTSKRLLIAGTLAGALLLGGVPALSLAVANEEKKPPRSAAPGHAKAAAGRGQGQGPPPWVHLRGQERQAAKQRWHDQRRAQHEAWLAAKREQQKAWLARPEAERQGPPPWAGGPWKAGG